MGLYPVENIFWVVLGFEKETHYFFYYLKFLFHFQIIELTWTFDMADSKRSTARSSSSVNRDDLAERIGQSEHMRRSLRNPTAIDSGGGADEGK